MTKVLREAILYANLCVLKGLINFVNTVLMRESENFRHFSADQF